MRTILIALPMTLAATAALAGPDPAQPYSPQVAALRTECSQKYYSSHAGYEKPSYNQQYYDKYGYDSKYGCTEDQYASYLDSADPERVMAAYPSGAGRPTSKTYDKSYDKSKDSYDKDKKQDDKSK